MRTIWVWLMLAGCAPELLHDANLTHANLRVPYQTDPSRVLVFATDIDQPYDVLADLEITARQRSAFGDKPTQALATHALQREAAKIGAHAVIMVSFVGPAMSMWSYGEMKGQGRAIRFR